MKRVFNSLNGIINKNKFIMKKYLVTIEFRYTSKREYSSGGNIGVSKTITIGMFDNFDTACIEGNKALEVMESKFKPNIYADGRTAPKERFSKNGGAFNSSHTLITNLGYLKTPFSFFAKIGTLHHEDTAQAIEEVLKDLK